MMDILAEDPRMFDDETLHSEAPHASHEFETNSSSNEQTSEEIADFAAPENMAVDHESSRTFDPSATELRNDLNTKQTKALSDPLRVIPTEGWAKSRSGNKIKGNSLIGEEPTNDAPPYLLSLPIDSLHSMSSFLSPLEWKTFGLCSKGTNKIARDVFRKVYMHGFRCATEVVMAWKCGQHADAKELCALYIGAGVPIYPHCLGHSYHTLFWRLSIEAKHLSEAKKVQTPPLDTQTDGDRTTEAAPIDPFYTERDESRRRGELIVGSPNRHISYLEEKALNYLNTNKNNREGSRRSSWTRMSVDRLALDPLQFVTPNGAIPHRNAPTVERWKVTRSNSFSGKRSRTPKISMKIHRHLLDQHLLGRSAVNDGDGAMITPSVSLSADFFHPFFSFRSPRAKTRKQRQDPRSISNSRGESTSLLPAFFHPDDLTGSDFGDHSDSDLEAEMAFSNPLEPAFLNNTDEVAAAGAVSRPPSMVSRIPPMIPSISHRASIGLLRETNAPEKDVDAMKIGILSNVDLDVYSASSRCPAKEDCNGRDTQQYLRARFTSYHRCLERYISKNDHYGFEETIMDFWDEFLPQTAGIQYYDKHSAVPRISRLESFLTKPCPKAIGIVQCEIERVNLGTKKKGVNMKGRFFPTYEYRLFIRHRPSEVAREYGEVDENNSGPKKRRDTILMMAKNKGRKYAENSRQPSKKGSNNFYLSLPQQDDIDLHYQTVNELNDLPKPAPNGVKSLMESSAAFHLLGRLQSNFVGTEFQIFTPRVEVNMPKYKIGSPNRSMSQKSGCSLDDAHLASPTRARNRFRRLSLKGRSPVDGRRQELSSAPFHSTPLSLRRSLSGDAAPGRNRKVSAAESFESHHDRDLKPAVFEQEDGAITYTANLLGSRPRIMDVCIPKISHDGPGSEWKRYLENCADEDPKVSSDRLLNYLKQLQQNGQMDEHGRLVNPANSELEVQGSDENDYSPPGDLGLLTLQNRPPWWNVELGSFVLNFGGRVSVASVKNFQLCDRNDQDYIMLQFGRIEGRHAFTMDFQHPLTAVQAFAIAISSLQSKIAFG